MTQAVIREGERVRLCGVGHDVVAAIGTHLIPSIIFEHLEKVSVFHRGLMG
jgi:hypothetical protein